jgi:beta-xylosidase
MVSIKVFRVFLTALLAASNAQLLAQVPASPSQSSSSAADPIIQTKFTADPAPMVHDGVVYLYTGHDEDDATHFTMHDWQCYSSTDMVNWTDLGPIASLKTFPWAKQDNGAWAAQVVARNGKFYLYATVFAPGSAIGVAVADKPTGPFVDALGGPLVRRNNCIDPTILIDDDGQAYLYWGNPDLYYVKLNKDMISTSGEIVKEPSVAKERGKPDPFHYQEGPWAYKRNGHYYMAYATTCCPEGLGYAMSNSPTGPWEPKGYIMKPDGRSNGNHPGIIDYKGKSYVFGFDYKLNFALTDRHRERRSVCVTEIHYNPDGTIQEVPWWNEAKAVEQIGTLNPYARVEAETMCWSQGIKSEPSSQGGMCVYPASPNAFIKVKGVNFGAGAGRFHASIAGASKDSMLELRLDRVDGPLIGTLPVGDTGGIWKAQTIPVSNATGTRDLFFVFKDSAQVPAIKFGHWMFDREGAPRVIRAAPVPVNPPGTNPIFRDQFTADPAALVVGDTVYVYAGHDGSKPGQGFVMPEWLCYSSKDMKTWTAHGPIMRPEEFSFARAGVAWAAQMVPKDGKYFFYTTLRRRENNQHCIGVAVGDSPTGPFKDARGTPLITDDMTTDSRRPNADIDPTVFIDDDGTPWLMWGNGDFYLAKLKRNMIELDGPVQKMPHENVAEGPWLFKRKGIYYNVYAADVPGTKPEQIAYATADKVTGPWTYRGLVTGPAKAGFTIHPAVIEFKGQWYFFYHDGSTSLNGLPGGDFRRSVCLEYLSFNPDGSIRPITQTPEGVSVPPSR